ncbi:glycoside hydrolase family 32 protein [Lederbergia graminis]|uniref:Glycoside hydrolase family 32 protein n=1 Tax=Lederbergia graminis TaxID=735518 RepID=A0ABW0LL42_9BACI
MNLQKIDKYRPNLHFAPKENWMNDPNGLVYFKGEYHLFFQHNPNDSVWGPMYWGHAVSKDLITWKELDIALSPDENGTIFSGSAVVDWDNTTGFFPEEPGLVAIFTHHKDGAEGKPPVQTQSIAYSHDQGRTWIKYDGNPVLRHETKVDFRDPKVFWHEDKWIMVLATGQTISFYSSFNLIDWQFESEFGEGAGSHDGVWECPDLFKLKVENSGEEKWVLLVSIGDNPQFEVGSRTQYFIGSFNGSTFVTEHNDIRWLDFGRDNYAGVSFSDIPREDGRRIYLGWMSNWRYANQVPTHGWRSQMTIPRELSVRKINGSYIVIQRLVKELDSYFSLQEKLDDIHINDVETIKVDARYMDMVFELENMNAKKYGITIHHSENHSTTITIDTISNSLILDREKSGDISFSEMFSNEQVINLKSNDNIQLRIVVDSSSVELLVNDGEYALTSLVYPDKACDSISIFSLEGDVKLKEGNVYVPK